MTREREFCCIFLHTDRCRGAACAAGRIRSQPPSTRTRLELLEEEDRWLKAHLFARPSEKMPVEERHPDQARLFNEAEAVARAAEQAPISVTIPSHERDKGGRKKLSALPRIEVVHNLPEDQERCAPTARRSSALAKRLPSELLLLFSDSWLIPARHRTE